MKVCSTFDDTKIAGGENPYTVPSEEKVCANPHSYCNSYSFSCKQYNIDMIHWLFDVLRKIDTILVI